MVVCVTSGQPVKPFAAPRFRSSFGPDARLHIFARRLDRGALRTGGAGSSHSPAPMTVAIPAGAVGSLDADRRAARHGPARGHGGGLGATPRAAPAHGRRHRPDSGGAHPRDRARPHAGQRFPPGRHVFLLHGAREPRRLAPFNGRSRISAHHAAAPGARHRRGALDRHPARPRFRCRPPDGYPRRDRPRLARRAPRRRRAGYRTHLSAARRADGRRTACDGGCPRRPRPPRPVSAGRFAAPREGRRRAPPPPDGDRITVLGHLAGMQAVRPGCGNTSSKP